MLYFCSNRGTQQSGRDLQSSDWQLGSNGAFLPDNLRAVREVDIMQPLLQSSTRRRSSERSAGIPLLSNGFFNARLPYKP